MAGLLMAAAHILYFFLMKVFGLIHIVELRGLNFFIQLVGVILTLRYFRQRTQSTHDYFQGMAIGCYSSGIGVFIFSVFIYFYFKLIDHDTLIMLKSNAPMMGRYLTPFSSALTIMIEGMTSGLIVSFALMQYFKDDSVHAPGPGK